ncbi:autotransporter assembly complex protein TamA [Sulfitobacter sp. SK012]|uniref:autotransporter assembly complex protein TamA n=1 Tax=Sulfitobacter sp. SK012 TaxID=1389005 RepID=UPI0020C7D2E3|nr:autotransporter assembly complex family protein [Sulfitobacter sp. SK012]
MGRAALAVLKYVRVGVIVAFASGSGVVLAADVKLTGISSDNDLFDILSGGSLLVGQSISEEEAKPSSAEILAAAQADYKRLLAVLYDNGYFSGALTITVDGREAASISPVQPPANINKVIIDVELGPKFKFDRATIDPVAPGTELPNGFAIGETASLGVLKQTVSTGINGWRDAGYAKAELASQDLIARHQERTVSADLRLNPGPKLRFGPLTVKDPSNVRTERILDIAGLPEGEVYSPEELKLATERLRRTGAFNAVALIEAGMIGPEDTLPISASLTDAPLHRFGFGAEYGDPDGLSLTVYWLNRNLFGGAESLRIDGEISGVEGANGGTDYLLSALFKRPATFNEDTNFFALASIEQLDEVSYFSRQLDLVAGVERIASEERTYRLGLGLRTAQTRDAFGENRYTLLTLPTGAEFDYRDNELDTKNGFYIDLAVMPFLALSGADDGVRSFVDARAYKTFGTTRAVTFALRGQLGSVLGPDLSVAPADYLFYSGGGGTVRGQPYESLGVDLGNGETVGGRSFVGLSAEVRVQATESFGVVGFFDAGYIGEEEFYDGSGTTHSGAGLGIRYATGIGPIRFDVGVPTSGPETGDNFQIYIGIGQAF